MRFAGIRRRADTKEQAEGLVGGITGQGRLFGTAYGAGGGEAAEAREAWGRGISQVLGETPPLTARLCLPVSKKKQRQWIGPTGLNQTGEEQ